MTEFYITPMMEQRGDGEVYCDFDTGNSKKVLIRLKIVSTSKAVLIGTLYSNPEEYVHDDTDVDQLDSLLRIILGYVSRVRLIKKLEEFGFSDLDGYRNFRAFARFMDINNAENRLGGKVAFYLDLHNFTIVNQEIGRENGDIVMRKYYDLLSDTIGDTGIIIRLGGDKFLRMISFLFLNSTLLYQNSISMSLTTFAGTWSDGLTKDVSRYAYRSTSPESI